MLFLPANNNFKALKAVTHDTHAVHETNCIFSNYYKTYNDLNQYKFIQVQL